jgi:hypothetical protein
MKINFTIKVFINGAKYEFKLKKTYKSSTPYQIVVWKKQKYRLRL